jgi:hypothetical protein
MVSVRIRPLNVKTFHESPAQVVDNQQKGQPERPTRNVQHPTFNEPLR